MCTFGSVLGVICAITWHHHGIYQLPFDVQSSQPTSNHCSSHRLMVSPSLCQFFLYILNSESISAREKRYRVSGVNLVMKKCWNSTEYIGKAQQCMFLEPKCLQFDSKVFFPKEDQPSQKDAQNGESVRRGGLMASTNSSQKSTWPCKNILKI